MRGFLKDAFLVVKGIGAFSPIRIGSTEVVFAR
jgi:hypothetical protein